MGKASPKSISDLQKVQFHITIYTQLPLKENWTGHNGSDPRYLGAINTRPLTVV